jgi:hypothetical protein
LTMLMISSHSRLPPLTAGAGYAGLSGNGRSGALFPTDSKKDSTSDG